MKLSKDTNFLKQNNFTALLSESVVRLPYHQPTVLPITHFLKRVPLADKKKTDRYSVTEARAIYYVSLAYYISLVDNTALWLIIQHL